jgi:transposase InsO family protein
VTGWLRRCAPTAAPTTTGKIERFHRSLRVEFDTRRVFSSLRAAQQALDEWVAHYNTERPHQALEMTPRAIHCS